MPGEFRFEGARAGYTLSKLTSRAGHVAELLLLKASTKDELMHVLRDDRAVQFLADRLWPEMDKMQKRTERDRRLSEKTMSVASLEASVGSTVTDVDEEEDS